MTRNPNTHTTRIEDGNPDRLRRTTEDWIARARRNEARVQRIRPLYDGRRLVGYDVTYIAPAAIPAEGAPAPAPAVQSEPLPAPAIVATPLGLAYLLPGIEPAPVRLSEHVAQAAMF